MNNKDSIIEKILSDAKFESEEIVKCAEENYNKIINKTKIAAENEKNSKLANIEDFKKDIIDRNKSVAILDSKKTVLNAKVSALDNIFAGAIEKFIKIDKKTYLNVIKSLISKWADDGDVVVIAQSDKTKITKKFVDEVAKEINIKLSLSKEFGDFVGGIVLQSTNHDKNLTIETEMASLREEIETEIAKIAFVD